jgi:hypothetical protein
MKGARGGRAGFKATPRPRVREDSEFALIQGLHLVDANKPIRVGAVDRQPVTNAIKAALLAREQDGSIRMEIENQSADRAGSLMIVPTERWADWPRATMESRLVLDRKGAVADIVFEWLGDDSSSPWAQAAEKGMIMLVLRGFAVVQEGWRGRTYALADEARALLSQDSPQTTENLFSSCRENRPSVWRLLEVEIEDAVRRRTLVDNNNNRPSPDPWESEAATDREHFLAQPHIVRAKGKSGAALALVGVALAVLDAWIARKNDLAAFAVVAAGSFAVAGVLLAIQPKALQGFQRQLSRWIASKHPSLSEQPPPSLGESLTGLVFWVPLFTLFALLLGLAVSRPVLWIGAVGLILSAAYRLLQALAGQRIDERVKGDGARTALRASAPPLPAPAEPMGDPSPAEAPVPKASSGDGGAQVELEIVTADAIPPASAASQTRIAAIRMRPIAIRSVYRKGVAGLAIFVTLLALVYWLIGPSPFTFSDGGVQFSERAPWFVVGSLVATLVLTSRRAQPWLRSALKAAALSAIIGGEVKFTSQPFDETYASIRPLALRLLATFWIAVALLRAATTYRSLGAPLPLIFGVLSIAAAFGCLIWIRRAAAAVERQYPYQSPLNLLALRVFGSGSLGDFLNLSGGWQWIGIRQLLDGPDSAGHKAKDLFNYLAGRIDRSIVKDEAELRRALDAFSARPDRRLRFPLNSMQCANATWKEAVQNLLNQADVVVMDLSGLSEQNRGVAYELGKLVNEVPVNRIVLVFDESTDLNVLRDILARASRDMAADSPNREASRLSVRLFDMGRSPGPKPDESVYDWKRRMGARMNENELVGLLYDAAQPQKSAASIDPKRDWAEIGWSGLTTSRPALVGRECPVVGRPACRGNHCPPLCRASLVSSV